MSALSDYPSYGEMATAWVWNEIGIIANLVIRMGGSIETDREAQTCRVVVPF